MKGKINLITALGRVLELAIALVLTLSIGAMLLKMVRDALPLLTLHAGASEFRDLLNYAFTLIVGIEFVKMVIQPSARNVVEVLVFAVARFLILEHGSVMNNLIGVVTIALLFAIQKYLICDIGEPHIDYQQWLLDGFIRRPLQILRNKRNASS